MSMSTAAFRPLFGLAAFVIGALAMGVGASAMPCEFWLAILIGGICLLVAVVTDIKGIPGGPPGACR